MRRPEEGEENKCRRAGCESLSYSCRVRLGPSALKWLVVGPRREEEELSDKEKEGEEEEEGSRRRKREVGGGGEDTGFIR